MKWTRDSLFEWAKKNRKKLSKEFFVRTSLLSSDEKTAIFMAGSPGAGKTEFIKRLLTNEQRSAYYVLDLDEIRNWMPEYTGDYAEEYTKGAIKILEMLLDECLHYNYNFILDGTFTNTEAIDRNMNRLLEKGYRIQVFYIHTQPYLAWVYTLLRGSDDNRRVPIFQFIQYYHLAYKNVLLALQKFNGKINISIAHKVRDSKGNINLDEKIFNPRNQEEMNDIFDKNIRFYYNLGKDGIIEKLFFYLTKFISIIPHLGKPILKKLAQIPK